LGRILPNLFADSFGVLNIEIFMSLAAGVLILAFLGIGNIGGVVAFAILYGFFSGGGLFSFPPAHSFDIDLFLP
jgi:hypothetical protein